MTHTVRQARKSTRARCLHAHDVCWQYVCVCRHSRLCIDAARALAFMLCCRSFGNPTIFATDGDYLSMALVPLDDVFETHAHAYQRALRRHP